VAIVFQDIHDSHLDLAGALLPQFFGDRLEATTVPRHKEEGSTFGGKAKRCFARDRGSRSNNHDSSH
jgi:hypothetical protein